MKAAETSLNGVILAGGKSARFGRDKARLEMAGARLVERLAGVLLAFPFRKLAIVTAKGRGGDWPAGLEILFDDREGLGPIGAIATALRHLGSGLLVVACDMPFVSAPLVRWLLEHYDSGADAIVPRHSGGIEPLFAIYEKGLLPTMELAIESGSYALHAMLEKARVRFVDVPRRFSAAREFANINTPEDYERALKRL